MYSNVVNNYYGVVPQDIMGWSNLHYGFIDFGIAVQVPESGARSPIRRRGFRSVRVERAPEVATVFGVLPDDPFACDVYMMGNFLAMCFSEVCSISFHYLQYADIIPESGHTSFSWATGSIRGNDRSQT